MEVVVAQEQEQEEQLQHELVQQLQFPPGYRFVPTESELVNYLRRKIEGRELPLHVVNEVAILDWQPGSLVETYKGYGENRWLFFTIREPSSSNKEEEPNRKVRAPGVKATWKATGSVVPISAKAEPEQQGEEKVVVGTKRVLIYHSSDAEEHGKWSMHEYILNGHAKIGQYALCSIQRKQHSDIVDDDAGEEGSSSSGGSQCNKRTEATDVDPEKTKNKRRRTNKAASAQSEVVQPQQQETTPIELALLKPKPKTIRRAATNRKNKASLEAEGQQQKQEHQEVVAPVIPVEPPLTPPGQAPPRALQQEQKALQAAYSEPPVGLPGTPLHGYPSPPDGMFGSSAPLHEEGTPSLSFPWHDYDMLSDHLAELESMMAFCNEEGPPPSFTVDNYAQYQLYQQQYFFQDNSTQNNSSWTHGQDQIHQHEIGGSFGAQDQHANKAQYHEESYYNVQPDVPLALLAQQTGYCSSDQNTDTAASGSDADLDLTNDDFFNCEIFLRDDYPQDGVTTQDESSPEALKSQGDEPWWPCGQQQPTVNGHVYNGQPSLACSISELWPM